MDIAAGVVAIVLVVGSSMAWHRIGSDFRGIFALTAVAFFLAGFVRGGVARGSLGWKAVRLSVGGFLGTGVLILSNGLHRLSILVGLAVVAVAVSAAGVVARENWRSNRRRSIRVVAISLAASALIVLLAVPRISSSSAFDSLNRAAPEFVLVADPGMPIGPAQLRGRVAVLAFWASWCLPCRQELPELQKVYTAFASNRRVAFYAVDTGWGDETATAGRMYLAGRHLDLPLAFDKGDAARALGVDGLPTLAIIDRHGQVRFVHHGYDVSEDIEEGLTGRIRELLAEN
jgi:thiol-disulfide isomerase/thioredoxin